MKMIDILIVQAFFKLHMIEALIMVLDINPFFFELDLSQSSLLFEIGQFVHLFAMLRQEVDEDFEIGWRHANKVPSVLVGRKVILFFFIDALKAAAFRI